MRFEVSFNIDGSKYIFSRVSDRFFSYFILFISVIIFWYNYCARNHWHIPLTPLSFTFLRATKEYRTNKCLCLTSRVTLALYWCCLRLKQYLPFAYSVDSRRTLSTPVLLVRVWARVTPWELVAQSSVQTNDFPLALYNHSYRNS